MTEQNEKEVKLIRSAKIKPNALISHNMHKYIWPSYYQNAITSNLADKTEDIIFRVDKLENCIRLMADGFGADGITLIGEFGDGCIYVSDENNLEYLGVTKL